MTDEVPTIKPALKKVILDALQARYTSHSSMDSVETGNHYQSVSLGGDTTAGFRSRREALLDRVDFRSKRVLDLGANLGEISRAARNRGARLVDGYEYDSFFVELADAINAFNGTDRVSFYQRDITDRAIYKEHYDIVLALSVFIYLREVLDTIAEITDGVLVLETHHLEHNLESIYLDPIGRYFPHHVILGTSEWGSVASHPGERAVIAFAKTDDALRKHIAGLGAPGMHFRAGRRQGTVPDIRMVDVARTPWYDRFFATFKFDSAEQTLAAVEASDVDLQRLAHNGGPKVSNLGDWMYWLVYLKGALQSSAGRPVDAGNVYYDLLGDYGNQDPGRNADVGDVERRRQLVCRRFEDFNRYRLDPRAPQATTPIQLVVTDGPPTPSVTRGVKRIYEAGREVPVETATIDGYHRLFLARLFGHKAIPCDFVAQRDAIPEPST